MIISKTHINFKVPTDVIIVDLVQLFDNEYHDLNYQRLLDEYARKNNPVSGTINYRDASILFCSVNNADYGVSVVKAGTPNENNISVTSGLIGLLAKSEALSVFPSVSLDGFCQIADFQGMVNSGNDGFSKSLTITAI